MYVPIINKYIIYAHVFQKKHSWNIDWIKKANEILTEIWRTQCNLYANYKEQNIQQAGLNHALVNLIVIAAAVLFAVCHFPRPPTGKIHSLVYTPPPFTPFTRRYLLICSCMWATAKLPRRPIKAKSKPLRFAY